MAVPHVSTNFGDLLDPRFQKIFVDQYEQLPDMIPILFTAAGTNGRNDIRWSAVGAFGDFTQFTGTVEFKDQSQGYDVVATPLEFASGMQVERKLFDDDQYSIMDQRPAGLALSANRTRQKHAARVFNLADSIDTLFYVNSEGVALVSDSHTTTSGASTSNGFDNKGTSALTATAVATARIAMVGYRDDNANRIAVVPDELWVPPDLYEEAFEIVASRGKVDTADNNANVHNGQYAIHEWNYMTDSNNWFMADSAMRKRALMWSDRMPLEFAFAEDLDTIVAKWRAYMRYTWAFVDWRWVYGGIVA